MSTWIPSVRSSTTIHLDPSKPKFLLLTDTLALLEALGVDAGFESFAEWAEEESPKVVGKALRAAGAQLRKSPDGKYSNYEWTIELGSPKNQFRVGVVKVKGAKSSRWNFVAREWYEAGE